MSISSNSLTTVVRTEANRCVVSRAVTQLYSALALLLVAVSPQLALGQEATENATTDVEEIVVLGSRIPARSNTDLTVAVDVLSDRELDNTGSRETARAIQAVAPSFNFSSSTISDGTDAVRPSTLRGLGPDQTLVLVNGRRRHQSALINVNGSVGRGSAGVDINAIPVGAIEQIEVLRDGASALYGSDALAGVINIKLKRSGTGKVHFDYGQYGEGDGTTPHIWWHDGWDIGDSGFVTLTVASRDRERTNRAGVDGSRKYPYVCTGDGTTDVFFENVFSRGNQRELFDAEATNFCGGATDFAFFTQERYSGDPADGGAVYALDEYTNPGTYRIGDADSEQLAYTLNLEVPIVDAWNFFAFNTHSAKDSQSAGFFRKPEQLDRAFNGIDTTDNAISPVGESYANFTAYADGFLPQINTESTDNSFSFGVNGQLSDRISVDIAFTDGENVLDYFIDNSINASYWGVNADDSALTRTMDYMYVNPDTGEIETKTLEGPQNGPFAADSGGLTYGQSATNVDFVYLLSDDLGLAFGYESRSEDYSIRAGEDYSWANYGGYNPSIQVQGSSDANMDDMIELSELTGPVRVRYAGGIQVFPGFRPESAISRSRDSTAFYFQADYNQENWAVSGALRFEDYSDFGDVLTYKASARFAVADDFALRGAISTGFRAPSMHQLYFNSVSTIFQDLGNGLEPVQTGTFTNDSAVARALGIPQLTNESSNNLSLGFVWDPEFSPLSLTFDYYTIGVTDRVLLSSSLSSRTPMIPAEVVTAIAAAGGSSANVFYNAGDLTTTGFDLIIGHKWALNNGTDLDLGFSFNQTDTTLDSVAVPASLTGVSINDLFSLRDRDVIENWQPQTRYNLSLDWQGPGINVYGALRHIGEYNISASTFNRTTNIHTLHSQTIDPTMLIDARVTFNVGSGVEIVIGGENLTDEVPARANPALSGALRSREGPLREVNLDNPEAPTAEETVTTDNLGIFPFPRGAAPFGFNGTYIYFGVNYKY